MNFSTWSLVDVTLPLEDEQAARERIQDLINRGGTGDPLERYRLVPPSEWETELSTAYHAASTPQERIMVLEYWSLGLQQRFADMTRREQQIYGYRLHALVQLANSIINRELRAAQLVLYEQSLAQITVPTGKIVIRTWTTDLTRIHEAMRDAGIYSENTEVSKIVGMYHVETALKDIESSYRASKASAEERLTSSRKLLKFIQALVRQLTAKTRGDLVDFCLKLDSTNTT